MKAIGPIPAGYEAKNGQLAIGGKTATELVEEAGRTPLFVYSGEMISSRVAELREAMPERLQINYAVKANPFDAVLRHMAGLVDGFDIASVGELNLVRQAGIESSQVSFAGPGKRDEELKAAIEAGVTINCESDSELDRILHQSEQIDTKARVAFRVNPSFEIKGSGMKMGGGAKPFGIDAERVPDTAKRAINAGIDFRGLHIFAGSQALSAEALIETQDKTLELADKIANEVGRKLPKLNMGGGFGIPYFPKETPLNIQAIGEALQARFAQLPDSLADSEICLELGRFLIGEAGVYLTRIVDRKESHGHTFLVTDGGLHHQLAATGNFGTVVRRNYPSAIATRFDDAPTEVASIVGCLCTPLDRLADNVEVPKADVGDIVAIFCAGAYGATASPANFLGQGPAAERFV